MTDTDRVKVSFILKYDEESKGTGISAENNEQPSDFMPTGNLYELIADPILAELDSDSLLLIISACIRTLSKKHGLERAIDIASKAAEGIVGECPLSTEEQSDGESVDTWIEENEKYENKCGEYFGEPQDVDDSECDPDCDPDIAMEYIIELELEVDELREQLKQHNIEPPKKEKLQGEYDNEIDYDEEEDDHEDYEEDEEWKNSK